MRTLAALATLALAIACGGTSDPAALRAAGGAPPGTSGAGLDGVGDGGGGTQSAGVGASSGRSTNDAGGTTASLGEAGSSGGVAGGSPNGGGGKASVTGNGGSAGGQPLSWPCSSGTPCVILPLGDSITFGYGSTTGGGYRVPLLSRALAVQQAITFVGSVSSGPAMVDGQPFPQGNEGHSGYSIDDSSSTQGISPLIDAALATYKPNIVLLMIGTNDMHYKLDLANAPSRLGKLLDQITTDAPNLLLVVAQIIPANGAQNTPTQAYNAAIPGVVQARVAQGKHLVLVDMYAALNHWSTTLYKDSEHPNDAGYSAMADAWYAAIQPLLP